MSGWSELFLSLASIIIYCEINWWSNIQIINEWEQNVPQTTLQYAGKYFYALGTLKGKQCLCFFINCRQFVRSHTTLPIINGQLFVEPLTTLPIHPQLLSWKRLTGKWSKFMQQYIVVRWPLTPCEWNRLSGLSSRWVSAKQLVMHQSWCRQQALVGLINYSTTNWKFVTPDLVPSRLCEILW